MSDRNDLPLLAPIAQHEGGTLRAVRDGDVVEFRAGVTMEDDSERATYFVVPLEVMRREQHETIKRLESIIEEHKDVGRYYLGVIGDLERQLANLRTRAKHHLEVSQDHGDCPCCGAHVTAGGKHQDCDMFTPEGEVK